jgi:hypothetical protein
MCGCASKERKPEVRVPRSHNFDTRGHELPHPAGYYLIPANEMACVVARRQWDPRIMNAYRFVPLSQASPNPCAQPSPARRGDRERLPLPKGGRG